MSLKIARNVSDITPTSLLMKWISWVEEPTGPHATGFFSSPDLLYYGSPGLSQWTKNGSEIWIQGIQLKFAQPEVKRSQVTSVEWQPTS